MMISSKGEYGLRALLDLAQHYGKDPSTSSDIAARQQIPEAYLNHLLVMLRKRKLVHSLRGPQGGHELARPPSQITMADAIIAMEGGYSPTGGRNAPASHDEPLEADILRDVWRQVEDTIGQVLESISLDDLRQRKMAREQLVMYYI